ncbi:unnamed protein product [Notodromas monacha]|uniref:Anhydro-N-acetylmuramic acid kinase n=1 Tax=Notodromas monacha TaxID=399045 RepID=A0A7R9BLF0_9CRUS|nr:unnamed protein product [Notodromas monacha]CAG0916555.1 unnamed protein product [Notodromas monacha]
MNIKFTHFIGLMSGTSLDGVDGVLVTFRPEEQHAAGPAKNFTKVINWSHVEFPEQLHHALLELQAPGDNELHKSALAANDLMRVYAVCVENLIENRNIPREHVLIGAHGQTVRHQPGLGYTIQLINGALLAELTRMNVVCDFRSRDIAAAGQGAPLVPAFHQLMAKSIEMQETVSLCNIGGISNITVIPRNGDGTIIFFSTFTEQQLHKEFNSLSKRSSGEFSVFGYDCGPGTVLIDSWTQTIQKLPFDRNGGWAETGRVNESWLRELLQHEFFQLKPPKSTGRDLFNQQWLTRSLKNRPEMEPRDVQATLTKLTASSIANELRRCAVKQGCTLIVCGGGAKNEFLMKCLRTELESVLILTSDQACGIPVDQVEASAFAYLAFLFWQGRSGNYQNVTGASGNRILGCWYPR